MGSCECSSQKRCDHNNSVDQEDQDAISVDTANILRATGSTEPIVLESTTRCTPADDVQEHTNLVAAAETQDLVLAPLPGSIDPANVTPAQLLENGVGRVADVNEETLAKYQKFTEEEICGIGTHTVAIKPRDEVAHNVASMPVEQKTLPGETCNSIDNPSVEVQDEEVQGANHTPHQSDSGATKMVNPSYKKKIQAPALHAVSAKRDKKPANRQKASPTVASMTAGEKNAPENKQVNRNEGREHENGNSAIIKQSVKEDVTTSVVEPSGSNLPQSMEKRSKYPEGADLVGTWRCSRVDGDTDSFLKKLGVGWMQRKAGGSRNLGIGIGVLQHVRQDEAKFNIDWSIDGIKREQEFVIGTGCTNGVDLEGKPCKLFARWDDTALSVRFDLSEGSDPIVVSWSRKGGMMLTQYSVGGICVKSFFKSVQTGVTKEVSSLKASQFISAKDFSDIMQCHITELQKHIGEIVKVVGRVKHAGSVLVSPFGDHQGVALVFRAYRVKNVTSGFGAPTFTAFCGLSFEVVNGAAGVLVEVDDIKQWAVKLKETETIFNIHRDDVNNCLWSGGQSRNRHQDMEQRPNALRFWQQFGQSKDPVNRITPKPGGAAKAQSLSTQPRAGKEFVLSPGDTVVVIGKVCMVSDHKTKIVVSTTSLITNNPTVMPDLKAAEMIPKVAVTKPIVVLQCTGTPQDAISGDEGSN